MIVSFLFIFFCFEIYLTNAQCGLNQVVGPGMTCVDVIPFISNNATNFVPMTPLEIADGGSVILTFASGQLSSLDPTRPNNIFTYLLGITDAVSTVTPTLDCELSVHILATCDTSICNENSLFNNQNVFLPRQITQQGSIFINPANSFSINSFGLNCGCPQGLISSNLNFMILISNNIGNGDNCSLDSQLNIFDICSLNGNWTSVENVLPPGNINDGFVCLCDNNMVAGQNCQSVVEDIQINEEITVNLSQGQVKFFRFQLDEGFQNIFLRVIPLTSNCPIPIRRVQRNCGGCNPASPQFSSSRTRRFDLETSSSSFQLSDFGFLPQSCDCFNFFGSAEWFMSAEILQGTNCDFNFTIETQLTCDSSLNPVTGCNEGNCENGICNCPSDNEFVGIDCSLIQKDQIELFNGIVFREEFDVVALNPFRGYVVVAPLTNDRLQISVDAPSGNRVFGENFARGQNASGTIFFFAKWGELPDIVFEVTPLNFPYVNTSIDVNTSIFDFFESGPAIDFSVNINIDVPDNELHIIVYQVGIYNASSQNLPNIDENGNPSEQPILQRLQIEITLKDTFADVVNSLLIISFGIFVIWICSCYCVCPKCFHFCTRCCFPEIYSHTQEDPEEDVKEKDISENPILLHLDEPNILKVLLIALIGPFAIAYLFADKIPLSQLLDFFEQKIKDANMSTLQTIKIGELPHPFHPLEVVNIIRNLPTINLKKKIKIPSSLQTIDQLIEKIPLPNGPIDIHVTSLFGFISQLENVPDFDVVGFETWKNIFGRLPKISIPLIQITPDLDLNATLTRIRLQLKFLPNIPLELVNGLKNMTPQLAQLNVQDVFKDFISLPLEFHIPVDIPFEAINIDEIQLPDLNSLKDLSLSAKVKIRKKITKLQAYLKFFKLMGLETIALLGRWFIGISLQVFTIGLIFAQFAQFTTIREVLPEINELQNSVNRTLGDFWGYILLAIDRGFEYLDFFVILSSWNCGGVLTMVTPFLFFLFAIPVWIFLQKDVLLYFGIKLRIFSIAAKNCGNTFRAKLWATTAYVSTRLTILVMQATLFVLAAAATTSFTSRTCSDVDFVATSLGKVIVAIFFVIFYGIFFFTFTGAPKWEKYEEENRFLVPLHIGWDGVTRYFKMASGIWNEDTIRGYNIVYRAERYNKQLDQENQFGSYSITDPSHKSDNEKAQFHEKVMTLIAVSRSIIWIPIPLGTNLAKSTEYINQAHIFVFPGEEKLRLLRPFWSRFVIWLTNVLQLPLILAVVFSASSPVLAVLVASLLPSEAQRYIRKLIAKYNRLKEDLDFGGQDNQEETELPNVDN